MPGGVGTGMCVVLLPRCALCIPCLPSRCVVCVPPLVLEAAAEGRARPLECALECALGACVAQTTAEAVCMRLYLSALDSLDRARKRDGGGRVGYRGGRLYSVESIQDTEY